MTEYIVEITLLAESMTKDFVVPASMQVGELALLSSQAFCALTSSRYLPSANPILTLAGTGAVLDPDRVIQETEIRHGTRLLLY